MAFEWEGEASIYDSETQDFVDLCWPAVRNLCKSGQLCQKRNKATGRERIWQKVIAQLWLRSLIMTKKLDCKSKTRGRGEDCLIAKTCLICLIGLDERRRG
ncbi:hypothetical protein NMG60_11005124 [Bertholletia excelsa]